MSDMMKQMWEKLMGGGEPRLLSRSIGAHTVEMVPVTVASWRTQQALSQ